MKIGILASGNLGFHVLEILFSKYTPMFVGTDASSREIIEFCNHNNIQLFIGKPRQGRLAMFIDNNNLKVEILLSINYLFILERDILDRCKVAINFHGSLLPKYRGRTPHVWAIINNEKVVGVTAHLINEGCDTGDIVLQQEVELNDEMTGNDVLMIYKSIYPKMVLEVLNLIEKDTVRAQKQNEDKATYFGKRIPDDGLIIWTWHWERIKNWVRAQSFPYPGAFTFYKGKKLIIDKVEFADLGFRQDHENGQILDISAGILFVKTPNGVLRVTKIRNPEVIKSANIGDVLGGS